MPCASCRKNRFESQQRRIGGQATDGLVHSSTWSQAGQAEAMDDFGIIPSNTGTLIQIVGRHTLPTTSPRIKQWTGSHLLRDLIFIS